MPRNPDKIQICGPDKAHCVHEALVIVEETAFDDAHVTETNCQCLPSCTNIDYPHEISFSKLSKAAYLNVSAEYLSKFGCHIFQPSFR